MFIAKDINRFKSLFIEKLRGMLSDDELGAFILVLANSRQNEVLQKLLHEDLQKNFESLKIRFLAGKLKATEDDAEVFKKLLQLDVFDLPLWQTKKATAWEVSYNAIRQLRPARASSQIFDSIAIPFDNSRFHFNKAFLKPEILWQGSYAETNLRVLYNKFPFSDYHLLIAMSPEKNRAQLLTQDAHDATIKIVDDMKDVLPGFGVGYNSIAAGASVNHLHFQGFIRQALFPIEDKNWSHNGGEKDYPVAVNRFDSKQSSWRYLSELIEQDVAFNCLYRKNACYVIPRKYQSSVELPDWLTGAGWLDMAGVMTVSDIDEFKMLNEALITKALALLRC